MPVCIGNACNIHTDPAEGAQADSDSSKALGVAFSGVLVPYVLGFEA